MKVSVFKQETGRPMILVEASVGSGKPPLLVKLGPETNLREAVFQAIKDQTREETPTAP